VNFTRLSLCAALLAAGGAQAQLIEPAPATATTQLQAQPSAQSSAFARSFQPFPRVYGSNEAPNPDPKLFGDYRSDPKLTLGVDLGGNFGIEAGYTNLRSRGVHYVDMGRADERANALGTRGSSSYLAGKLTVPVDDRLTAYGTLGVAVSDNNKRILDQHDLSPKALKDSDVGVYAGVGARYKLSERATITGQAQRFGDTERKWGSDTNANGVSAKLKLGF
jgi:opacity protein-like surface antigen